MRRSARWWAAVLAGAISVLCAASPARAYFERLVVSSRAYSLGGAFVAAADDASAVVLNPAGLTQTHAVGVLSTISRPYGLSDLEEYFLSAVLPSDMGSFGLSWHRLALDGVTSEDLFTVAYGRDLVRTSQDASLSVGAAVDFARVAYSGDNGASEFAVAGTLSVLLRPFPFIGAGYIVRNVGEPSFDFPGAGTDDAAAGKTTLRATHAFGFAYHWESLFTALYERERGQSGAWRDKLGVEVKAGNLLRLRSGFTRDDITGGVGVSVSNVSIDASVTSHDALGLSAVVSVGISLPGGKEEEGDEW
jgi:hypothetical protein